MDSRDLAPARLSRVGELLRQEVEQGAVPGAVALVARHGTVHVEAAGAQDLASGAPMRRDTICRIASMTKPVLAAAAMTLVEDVMIGLDDPVDRWLPELVDRRVLVSKDAALDQTMPARRPISLRDLLTLRSGLGLILAPPGLHPIQQAMADAGVAPGPDPILVSPDDYMKAVGSLPLVHQPGEQWMYHTGHDILAVLVARVVGRPLPDVLRERLFEPLGMKDSGFSVPEDKIDRLATCYRRDAAGDLQVWDPARGGHYARPQIFPSQIVSTVDDYLSFARMLLRGGEHEGRSVLSRPSVDLMMSDQITPEQKALSSFFPGFWDNMGWGFGGAVLTRSDGTAGSVGRYGWDGGYGTTFVADPAEDMIVILLTQRLMQAPDDNRINQDVMTLAYAAIDG